jgi:hypothetical protein
MNARKHPEAIHAFLRSATGGNVVADGEMTPQVPLAPAVGVRFQSSADSRVTICRSHINHIVLSNPWAMPK